jgi:hypothetical protein
MNAGSSLLMTVYLSTYVKVSLLLLGELSEEEEVLQWLITQRTEERIELITRVMLEGLVEEIQYLAVYFCKYIVQTDTPAAFFMFEECILNYSRKLFLGLKLKGIPNY